MQARPGKFFYEDHHGAARRVVGFTCPSCGEHIGPRVGEVVKLGRIKIDTSTREAWVDGDYFDIARGGRRRWGLGKGKEITILIEMMKAPGLIFSSSRLMDITDTWDADPHIVHVLMCRLRRAFGAYLEFRNYRGDGYSLHARDEIVA